ncbi:MAG: hypothetical protein ABUL48_01020 [Pseudorhodoplanes sp.]
MAKVRCYGMYGLLGGPFPWGLYYSSGLDTLAQKIRALGENFEVSPTFGFSEWKKIASDISRQSDDTRIVIYGHSMGANQTTAAAAAVGGRSIDLIVAFDPTVWYPTETLGANVKHAISFRGTNILSPVGHGTLRTGPGFAGKLERFDVPDRHEIIDDNEKLHAAVLEAVSALAE